MRNRKMLERLPKRVREPAGSELRALRRQYRHEFDGALAHLALAAAAWTAERVLDLKLL